MNLPDLTTRLVCDASGFTGPFNQFMSLVGSSAGVMQVLDQAMSTTASSSKASVDAMNGLARALRSVGEVAGTTGGAMTNMSSTSGSAAASFSQKWIGAIGQVNAAMKTLAAPSAVASPGRAVGVPLGAPSVVSSAVGLPGTLAPPGVVSITAPGLPGTLAPPGVVSITAPGLPGTLAPPGIYNPPAGPGLPGTLAPPSAVADPQRLTQEAAAKAAAKDTQKQLDEAARAQKQSLDLVKFAWIQFGRDMMSIADQMTNRVGAVIGRIVPFFGPILGGAISGAGTGGHLGGAAGAAIGTMVGGPTGGMVGAGIGYVAGGLAGGAIGGQATALVQGITMAVGLLEEAFHKAASAAQSMVEHIVTVAVEFQRVQTSFEVFTGSAETGKRLFSEMQELAVKTPYTLRQLANEAQTLIGMGIPASKVTEDLRQLGDVAAGSGDRLRRLGLAYSEVVAEGRLTGQRIRQFSAGGVGVSDFAQTMGISVARFREFMREGSVDSQVVIDTFERLTRAGGRFWQLSQQQAGTVGGAWSNLIDKLDIISGKLGGAIFAKFNVGGNIQGLADYLGQVFGEGDKVGPGMEKLLSLVPAVQAALTGVAQAVKPYWDELVGTFERLYGALDLTPAGLERIRTAFLDFTAAVIQALGRVVTLVVSLAQLALPYVAKTLNNLGFAKFATEHPVGAGLGMVLGTGNVKFGGPLENDFAKAIKAVEKFGIEFLKEMDDIFARASGGIAKARGQTLPGKPTLLDLGISTAFDVITQKLPTAMHSLNEAMFPKIQILVSPEAKKLVEDLQKHLTEGLTPIDKFEIAAQRIREYFEPYRKEESKEGFVGPPTAGLQNRLMSLAFQQDIVDKYRSNLDPLSHLPQAAMIGSQEAAGIIAQSTTDSSINVEDLLKYANDQRDKNTKELEKINQALSIGNGSLAVIAGNVKPPPAVAGIGGN